MNNPPSISKTIPRFSIAGTLALTATASAMLFAAGRRDYANLHTILDTTASLLSGILSFLLWDLGVRNKQRFLQLGAVSFALTALPELVHAVVTVEWTGVFAPISDSRLALRPSTWPPAAFLLPVGLLGALWLARRGAGSTVWFALGLVGLNAVLMVLFYKLPRYSAPGWSGISRPTLVLVPVLWGVAAWGFWKTRKEERLMAAFAFMSAPLLLGHIAMLYSRAPHDTPAMVAHLGKTAGYLILLLSTMRLASIDMFQRIRTEADLTRLNQELEERVNERTAEVNAANAALSAEVAVRRVAEQEAREGQRKMAGIIDSAMDAVITVDNAQRVQVFNHAAEVMFLCPAAEALGGSLDRFLPERFRAVHSAHIQAFGGTGISSRAMARSRPIFGLRSDGTEFPLEASISQVEAGGQKLFTVIMRDVTERHRAEERFRQVIEHAPNGMVMVDGRGHISLVNAQIETSFGYHRDELIGQPIEVLVPERFRTEHPKYRDGFIAQPTHRSMGTGRDLFGLRKDGTEFPVEIGLNPVQTEQGVMVLGTIVDITERKRAEAERRTSEERYRTLFDYAPDGIVIADPNSYYLDANASICEMLGYSREEFVGMHASDIVAPEEVPHIGQALGVIKSEAEYQREWQFRRRDGSTFPAEVIATLMPDGNLLGVIRDITDRKHAEESLRASETKLSGIIQSAMDAIITVDSSQRVMVFNRAAEKMFLSPTADAIGQPLDQFIPQRFRDHHASHIESFGHTGVSTRAMAGAREVFGLRSDGTEFPIEASISQIESEGQKIFTVILRDVTERHRAEGRFRQVIEHAPNGMVMVDDRGRITLANTQIEKSFGYAREELIGQLVEILVPERFRSGHPAYRDGFIAHPTTRSMGSGRDLFGLRKDGSEFPVEIGLTPIETDTGMMILGTVVDITERKRNEEALRESEARLRIVTENARVGLVMVNAERQYTFANSAYAEILGLPSADIVGQHIADVLPHLYDEQVRPRLDLAFAGERVTYELNRPDHGVERYYAVSYEPMVAANAETMVVVVITEITDRKQAVIALQESKAELETIVENLDEGIAVSSLDGQLIHFNRAALEMHGFTDLAECRRHLTEFTSIFQLATLAGEVIPVDEWPLARILRGERLKNVEIAIHSLHDGRRLIFAYGGTLVHDETGRPLLAVVTIRDITEAKSAEQEIVRLNSGLERRVRERTAELQAVNKELEAFSYSVSHDLRAPLRHINGFSLALLEDYGDQLDAEGKGFLQEVRGASQEMSQLIDDVLQLARVTRAEMIREEVDLTALAEKTVATLRERDPGREVSVTIEPGLAARGDKRLLEITLVNLLGNAWKFTSKADHAQIRLTSEIIEGERVFSVRDNGAGFDQTFSDKLFRAFQRLHAGAEFEGTGIGLATVQRVINRHGGRVWAQGKVGRGASFFFTLTEP